jgi:hypothetical protein
LNKGLEFTKFNDEEVPRELEKLITRVSSSLDDDTGSLNFQNLSAAYKLPADIDKLDSLRKFSNGLRPNKNDQDKIVLLNDIVDKILNPNGGVDGGLSSLSASYPQLEGLRTISQLEDLRNRLNKIPRRLQSSNGNKLARHPHHQRLSQSQQPQSQLKRSIIDVNSNKIIIKTTRKLPSKVYTTCSATSAKKKTANSNTRVYEVSSGNDSNTLTTNKNFNSFNNSSSFNYSLKPFDPVSPYQSMTKPSVDQINKYLSVVNTGVKSNDLVQIHPIVNTQSNLKNKMGSSSK